MSTYEYNDSRGSVHLPDLYPVLQNIIDRYHFSEKRAFDLGCGSGAIANLLHKQGFDVVGVDPSQSGISLATKNFPLLTFRIGSSDDDLSKLYGTYPIVYSMEVIAHVINPRLFAKRIYELLEERGIAVVSAPFHGFWKNLIISILNKWDIHLNPLNPQRWINVFSERRFRQLWKEEGFQIIRIVHVGRCYPFSKSMIVILQKVGQS